MKMIIKAAMVAALLNASAAMAGDFKVGVVDTERVLRESVPAMNAEKRITKEFSGRDLEIKALIKQAKDLQALLEKEGVTMTDADQRNKERELTTINADVQRLEERRVG